VTKETPTTVSFELDGTMAFKAGQFVLLRPNASMPWRAYSFTRSPKQTPLRLTVKAVANGTVSVHLTSKLAAGDTLEVKGPFGQFVLPETFTRALFIAGGSGITPFLSQLHEQAEKGWPSPITLLDYNRSAAEQILKTELDALVASSGGKLEVVHSLDDAGGPPTKQSLSAKLAGKPAPDVVAMCGPEPLMVLARDVVMTTYPGEVHDVARRRCGRRHAPGRVRAGRQGEAVRRERRRARAGRGAQGGVELVGRLRDGCVRRVPREGVGGCDSGARRRVPERRREVRWVRAGVRRYGEGQLPHRARALSRLSSE
jgi:ferredoxin-NADP reductase